MIDTPNNLPSIITATKIILLCSTIVGIFVNTGYLLWSLKVEVEMQTVHALLPERVTRADLVGVRGLVRHNWQRLAIQVIGLFLVIQTFWWNVGPRLLTWQILESAAVFLAIEWMLIWAAVADERDRRAVRDLPNEDAGATEWNGTERRRLDTLPIEGEVLAPALETEAPT